MRRQIPNSVIGATASVIGHHYYSHSKLDTLFMELEAYNGDVEKGQQRIRDALAKNSLSYQTNGRITLAGSAPVALGLSDLLKRGDFASVEREFEAPISSWSSIRMPQLRRRVRSSKPFAKPTSRRLRWSCPRK